MEKKRRYRRGYPIAIIVGLEEDRAVIWKIFSNVFKPEKTVWFDGSRDDVKAKYSFHESIVKALRFVFNEGIRSIILVSPTRMNYTKTFFEHIRRHHLWLVQGPNKAIFSKVNGFASTKFQVVTLMKNPLFRQVISETTSEETSNIVGMLEQHLNSSNRAVMYMFEEIEELIIGPQKSGRHIPEFLLLTNKYLSDSREKNRLNRLIQIAKNRNIKTRIVDAESIAGLRLTQLGGIVCFTQPVN